MMIEIVIFRPPGFGVRWFPLRSIPVGRELGRYRKCVARRLSITPPPLPTIISLLRSYESERTERRPRWFSTVG